MSAFDVFDAFLDPSPRPPESLARRLLGIGRGELLTTPGVRSAFRSWVKLNHPDLTGREMDPDFLAELEWARDVLGYRAELEERRVASTVGTTVTDIKVPGGEVNNRNCVDCGGMFRGYGKSMWDGLPYAKNNRCCGCHHRFQLAEAREQRAHRRTRPCERCGTVFTPPRNDGRYCSPRCRQAAWRARMVPPSVPPPAGENAE